MVVACDTCTHLISRVKWVPEVPTCSVIAHSVSHYICSVSDGMSSFEPQLRDVKRQIFLNYCGSRLVHAAGSTACDKLQSVIVLLTDIQSPCWIFMPYLVCRGLSSSCTYIIETRQLFVHLLLLTQHDSLLLNQKKKFVAGLVLIHLRLDCVFCLLLTMCNKQTVVLLQSENQYSFRKSKDLQK